MSTGISPEARTVVLTGATTGIGLAAAQQLVVAPVARTLIIHGPQPPASAAPVIRDLQDRAHPGTTIHYLSADFTDTDAVSELADSIRELTDSVDVLINNAGIPGPRNLTRGPRGVEVTFEVNYLAGALLTDLLIPTLSSTGRVVNVASATHESARMDLSDLVFAHRPYDSVTAYAQSKLAIVTHSVRLAGLIPQRVISIHPGVISTRLLHSMFGIGGEQLTVGGENLAATVTVDVPSGSYLDEKIVRRPNPVALRSSAQDELHETTCRLLHRSIT